MSAAFEIRRVTAAETRPLKQRILWPKQRIEQIALPEDDDAKAVHFAAFVDGEIKGAASIYKKPFPMATEQPAYQLRGMSIDPEARRSGIGAALIRSCVDAAANARAQILWCRARTTALDFYLAMGFLTAGEEFDVPETGPHILAWRAL